MSGIGCGTARVRGGRSAPRPRECAGGGSGALRLVYFDRWPHAVALRMLAERPHFEVRRLSATSAEGALWPVFEGAHVYQISAARAEVPGPFFANAAFLGRCPELLVVSSSGSGFDTIDVDACTDAGVLALHQAGGNKEAVAEHALGMLLCLAKRIMECDRAIRSVPDLDRETLMGHEVRGRTLGIVGLGHVGTRMAELAGTLFDMRVIAYDPYLGPAHFAERGAEPSGFDALLAASDYVSVHCPRSAETTRMFDARAFARMRPHAHFINTARGGIHDEAALVAALDTGRIAGAGIDVWEDEPPPLDHPLLSRRNVVLSPHTAGVTHESRRNVASGAIAQLDAVTAGRRPPHLLNPEAWDRYAARFERAFGKAPG